MVHALRGMFAFGIWDEREQELFLARDPLGIKPLYYADDGGTFRFASLVDALISGGQRRCRGGRSRASRGSTSSAACPSPTPFTAPCARCRRARRSRVGRNGLRGPTRYFSITDEFRRAEAAPSDLSPEEADEQIRATLRDSMRHHLVSDVPVGIFLSSGVDSSVLAALGADLDPRQAPRRHARFSPSTGARPTTRPCSPGSLAEGLGLRTCDAVDRARRFPRRVAGILRRHGPGDHRRGQQLSRVEGGRGERTQGGDLGPGRRRALRRLPELSRRPAHAALGSRRAGAGQGAARAVRSRPAAVHLAEVSRVRSNTARATPAPICCAGRCTCPGSSRG